jgi:hypothetical protein
MANVTVVMDLTCRVTRKNADGKEISQHITKNVINLGELTEHEWADLHAAIDATTTLADMDLSD